MVDAWAVLPGVLEPERFFGRVAELSRFRREARSLSRGQGRSRVLCARAGSGKTQLLRQWHQRLFLEGEIFPFWFTFPSQSPNPESLAREFTASLALQALAFRRRDPALLNRPMPQAAVAQALRSTWEEGGDLLAEGLGGAENGFGGPVALSRAALAPHRLAQLTGVRVLCLLDDAEHLSAAAGALPWPELALLSPVAPAVFTVESESRVPRILGPLATSAAGVERLAPLSLEAASRLARHLARTAGLELEERAIAALAVESAGSPFYLGALIRSLAAQSGTGVLDVARAAASAACDGELARYWIERLAEANPDRRARATALEILTFCLRDREPVPHAGRLASLMLKSESDVESALEGLASAGVVRLDCARIVVDDDPVLRDVVRSHYRREFGSVPAAVVSAAIAAEKVRSAPEARRRLRRETLRAALRTILESWDHQDLPAILFDAAAYHRAHGAREPDAVVAELAGDQAVVTLPQVISVASGQVAGGSSLPDLQVDALAWALRSPAGTPEADVVWVARWLPGGPGAAEQAERFDRDVAALQMAGELPGTRIVRWAVLDAPLDGAGETAAARLRLSTSTLTQLEAMARLLGVHADLPPPEALVPGSPELEMEMVIPRVADVELVAARALEQLAENLEFDAPAIGKLKMALVEACINAFEHGGSRDKRVRLVFSVGAGRLVIRVENRGQPLAALPARAAAEREARGRGWGLTLIRELVDEVALEPREDGVSLLMVKHLSGGAHV